VRRDPPPNGAAGSPGSSIFGPSGPGGGTGGLATTLGTPAPTPDNVGASSTPSDNEMIERIIDAIEERVIAELERRGRRHHPGVF
jgi:hypothetical protein